MNRARVMAGMCLSMMACGWTRATVTPSAPPEGLTCAGAHAVDCFLPVSGGTFWMGAQSTDASGPGHDPDASASEGPPHQVTVSSFWLQRTEASWDRWSACVAAGACASETAARGPGALNHLVTGVTWSEAQALCRFVGGRLPSEAEWEFAARGTDGRRFPWGNELPCGLGKPHDLFVGWRKDAWSNIDGCGGLERPANPRGKSPHGMEDMAWAVWEWVEDPFTAGGYGGRPAEPMLRVQRGGAWSSADPVELRSAMRGAALPDTSGHDVGVRCAW